MKLVSIETIPGQEFEALDIVRGTVVYSKNFGRDFMAGMKTLVGGEITGYTEMLVEARQIATKRMVDDAEAMGADAVAMASAPLIAMACQQYRICGTGMCPVGVATQDPELRERLKIEVAAKRVGNFLKVTLDELKMFARITGHENLHDLNLDDLCTINREISEHTDIVHA